ncbi:MAG: phosphate ABC transporter substrate-binding protein PstS [Acidimicrobiia bacterium]
MKLHKSVAGLAALTAIGLVAAACGDDSSSSDTTEKASDATTAAGAATTKAATTTTVPLKGTLTASGATFPMPFYQEAIAGFTKANKDVTINYGGGGSGKGRTDLQTQVVDWAGSDGLVKEADKANYKGGEFLYFPTVSAPITLSYNVDGADKLQLSADTIAKIFQRQIKTWDDPAIAADNPGLKISGPITVARRSDGSGTTENFTIFLTKAAPTTWTLKSGSTVEWPADTQAGNGNAGVSQIVKSTKGAIGYIDLSDAKASGLKFASIKNKAGKFVAPTLDGVTAALAGSTLNADLSYDPLWADGDAAYPIAAPTWILAYTKQTDKVKGQILKAFLTYLYTDGEKLAPTVDYAALPKTFIDKAVAQLDKLQIPA